MTGFDELKQNGTPASKRVVDNKMMTTGESGKMVQAESTSLLLVGEHSKKKEMAGTSSEETSDKSATPMSSSRLKATNAAPGTAIQVSSDDESEPRYSNHDETSKIFIESTAPLPNVDENISPDEFLLRLVDAHLGFKLEPKKALDLKQFLTKATDEQIAAYTTEVVTAVRDEELDHLRRMEQNGQVMNCFNRFGESLLNLACRRGFESIVRYLLDIPDVNLRHSDDCGRTPLHDACWHPEPQLTICKWILEEEPALFFIMDRRGCTAFQYARPQHWPIWRKFLMDNRQILERLKEPTIRAMLTKV